MSGDVVVGWISYDSERGRSRLAKRWCATRCVRALAGRTEAGGPLTVTILRPPVPPVRYTDGVVTIGRQRAEDIDRHLEAIDDEQIDWLGEPGDRQKWEV